MNIKINGEKHKLKYSSQLTVREYIDYAQALIESNSTFEQLINYISIITGVNYRYVADINMSAETIDLIVSYIGSVLPVEQMPRLDKFYYKRKGQTLHHKSVKWRTLGARKMLEDRELETQLEQMVYLLAVVIDDNYDNDNVELIYNELMSYDALSVFGFTFFFSQDLVSGQLPATKCWLVRKIEAFISTRK